MTFGYNPLHDPPQATTVWTPVELTDPALALDDAPRVVARLQSAEHGRAMLSRLAIGDRSALRESGIISRTAYDTQVHEWGLGRQTATGMYFLVAGGPSMVNWDAPRLQGYEAVAHSHPAEPIDRSELVANQLTPRVNAALQEWTSGMYSSMSISFMPGGLWHLFPSNQDLIASYVAGQPLEQVYLPYVLTQDGWLSWAPGAAGAPLMVEYGPVRAALKPNAEHLVSAGTVDLTNPASMKVMEGNCLQYLYAPLRFVTVGGDRTLPVSQVHTGVLQVDALKGPKATDPQNAWYRAQQPQNTVLRTRAEVIEFIIRVKKTKL